MNSHSNFTILYQTSSRFEGKLTSFVTVMAQNIGVCVVLSWDYTTPKQILVYWGGSSSLGWESWVIFYSNLIIFNKASPRFGGKWTM